MINVLIVEDSKSARLLLEEILGQDCGIQVIGSVESGEEALRFLKYEKPDVITMDIVMPGIDGFTATRQIMETTPVPIVIVSSAYKLGEVENSFKAMEAGAVAIIEKPVSPKHPDYPRISRELAQTVKIMSEVRVVTRWGRNRKVTPAEVILSYPPTFSDFKAKKVELVVIGASTGGPPVIQTILSALPRNIPVPILIVQHISAGFVEGLARWLGSGTGFPIHIASHWEGCVPGHVYLAPDDCHMGITYGLNVELDKSAPENGQRPSVSYLFRSTARNYPKTAVGVLLSGMGNDGAVELKLMKDAGAITIAQDESSCVVFGMPGEAVKLGAAHYILSPVDIAKTIIDLIDK
jgi:two-component system, chemotaxis family, protein-glutamate methylesterase/glutaminase